MKGTAHFVSWKESVTPEQLARAKADWSALWARIPGFIATCWGPILSPNETGYTDCIVTIASGPEVFDAFANHPDHVPLESMILPMIEKAQFVYIET